jgi:dTMP kinase
MRELLEYRGFRRLLVGQSVSSLGDWMGTFALMYYVLLLSGSTTAVAGVLVLRLLPSAVGAPLAARAVSRWDRRQVMLTCDLIRAGMAILLPLFAVLAWVYVWAFLIEVVSLAFLPARDAAIPVLLDADRNTSQNDHGRLALANGVTMGTSYGMIPFGAGAFGLILFLAQQTHWDGTWRYVVIFWLDALTYLVSYLAVRRIPDLLPNPAEAHDAHPRLGFLQAIRIPLVRGIVPGVAVVAFGLGSLFSLGVVFVRNVLHAGPVGFGALVAFFGVGASAGLAALRRREQTNLLGQIRLGSAAQGVVIAVMGLLASEWLAFLGAILFGAAATTTLVGGITYIQENLYGVQRNLGLTAFHSVLRTGLAVSALISGAAADLIGKVGSLAPAQAVLILSGAVVFAGSFLVHDARPAPVPTPNPVYPN